ncbi:MAG: Xaa-Pro peptidase family protein [Thermodesulfovibrionales bacterium]|nr:Xaa-Pro peptidase family protein [Thermodesulfovibrionales bacterium]
MSESINKLQTILKTKKVNALLVSDINNVRYLTGFTGSSGFCILTEKSNFFFTDFRYTEQAEQEIRGWSIEIEKGKRIDTIKRHLIKNSIKNIAFETSIPFNFYLLLKKIKIPLKPLSNLIENLRQTKSMEEISHIKEAYKRAEDSYIQIKGYIKAGIKESDIALRLENAVKKKGCRRLPFDIIVASGHNSSRPHATVTDKKLQKGDFVTIDWGAEYKGYYSDMTRTLLIKGNGLDEKIKIYNIVNEARAKAIKGIKVGEKAKAIDNIARKFIEDSGFGEYFGHGLGHGIGLQAHEEPRINKMSKAIISNGMVFTIEPGIYIRDFGGVRIEDTVFIQNDKVEVLNKLSSNLEIVG